MHIAVCVKRIPDPEIAPSVFRVDEDAKRVIPLAGLPPVISPFDEQAVEAALRIRDAASEPKKVRITALTIDAAAEKKIIKHVLALGADAAVMLCDAAFEDSDGYATALTLARAIGRLGDVDLVLAGRQAADTDSGAVGPMIAELLGMPAITFAGEIEIRDGTVRVVRALGDAAETVEAPLPALVTVAHELGRVRKPGLRETMQAAKKPIETWSAGDIGLEAGAVGRAGARRVLERLYRYSRDARCEYVPGDNPSALATALVRRLIEEKIL